MKKIKKFIYNIIQKITSDSKVVTSDNKVITVDKK